MNPMEQKSIGIQRVEFENLVKFRLALWVKGEIIGMKSVLQANISLFTTLSNIKR